MDACIGDVKGLTLQKLNEETDTFRKALHILMKIKGFTRTFAGNRSAMYDWTYERGNEMVAITGWHGTGKRGTNRHWGGAKTVMCLYYRAPDAPKHSQKQIVEIDNFSKPTFKDDVEIPDTRTVEDLLRGHTEGVAKMLHFVRDLP